MRAFAGDPTSNFIDGARRILDIVIDPQDWRTAYAVDQSKVYMTTNAGADWTTISQKLNNTNLRSLEIVETGGQTVLLVGGALGVYKTIDPAGVNAIWTEYGAGLPNVNPS